MINLPHPAVMGILNVTPDSFSDGGQFVSLEAAVSHARQMASEGAHVIDIGGESTRPGAAPVTVAEELARVVPVIEAIRSESPVPISVDTSTPEVMLAAARAGASFINDVRALQRPGACEAAAETGLPVGLMHMQGEPGTMQDNPHYEDLFGEIEGFFEARMRACEAAGISRDQIWLDPGFGFGKTPQHNLQLIHGLARFGGLGCPLLVGLSRKSTIGRVLEGVTTDRLMGSVAGAVIAVERGAAMVRVHDVAPTVAALTVATAIREAENQGDPM